MRKKYANELSIFRKHNGILRAGDAKKLGIHQQTIKNMFEAGFLVKESWGLYRLADIPPLSNPDLVQVALRIPESVICLISALNFHDLTTQIPYQVYIALRQKTKPPRFDYPPLDIVYLSEKTYSSGIEEHFIDGVAVHIYNKEKTVTDCFKFRNKIGKDVALEALKDYLNLPDRQISLLLEYSKVNRVERIIRPYIEATS